MMYSRDPFDLHTEAVEAVAAAGVAPPPEWTKVRQRFDEYTYLTSPALGQLSAAVINGHTADVATLRALALAEVTAMPPNEAQVRETVKRDVLNKLRDLYAPVAAENYGRLGAEFNTVADRFAAACAVIDPERDPAAMLDETDKARKSYMDAEVLAHQLTAKMGGLAAAASLAGSQTNQREALLALTVDASGLHRRRVWEAFEETGGRTGRWGALLGIGARIRAADLDSYEPYRKPKPMEVKQIRHGIGVRQVMVDPEDAPEPEPAMT